MSKMFKIIGIVFIVFFLGILILFGLFIYKSRNFKDKKDLEAIIDKQVQQYIDDGNSPAVVIGIVKNGKTFIKGYGTTDLENNIKPDGLSLFELASTSKLFTTSTFKLLTDEGILNLDDRIGIFLKNKVELSPSAKNVTLEHLATHQSGFPPLPNSFIQKMKDEQNPYNDLVEQDIYDYLLNCEGKTKEGQFEYSNFGMGLLGHLMQLRTGITYEELVKMKLLKPLNMNNTFVTIPKSYEEKIVQGFNENRKKTPIWTDNVLTGAGSFISNATDMVKFIEANLNENTSLSKSLIQTHSNINSIESGLGWLYPTWTDKLVGNTNLRWHNGMAGGYASFIAIDKENNFGVVLLSNQANDISVLGMKLALFIRTQSWKQ